MKTILTLFTLLISLILPQNHTAGPNANSNESVKSVAHDDYVNPSLVSKSPSGIEHESVTAYSDGEDNSFLTSFVDTYVAHGSPIIVDYSFPYALEEEIIGISVTSSGVVDLGTYVSSIDFDQFFELEFECSDYGTDEIVITFSISNETQEAHIFVKSDNECDYISVVSFLGCRQQEFMYLYDQELMSEDDYNIFVYGDEEPIEVPADDEETGTPGPGGGPIRKKKQGQQPQTVTIKGYIKWYDKNGNLRPARKMEIQIWDYNLLFDSHLATVYTNDAGYYTKTVPNNFDWWENGIDVMVQIVFRNNSFEVFDNIFVFSYRFSHIAADCSNGDVLTYSHTFDLRSSANPSVRDRAISVFQAATYGFEYLDLVDATRYYLSIQFESWFTGLTSFYNFSINTIHLKGNNYDDWDTILHEFGHFAADKEEFTDYWPANHSFDQNQNDAHGKWIGPMLSWSEGFATYFSMASQEYTSLKNLSPMVSGTCDMKYGSYNIESSSSYLRGEGNEFVIARFLWDLQDAYSSSEPWDNINWGYEGLWQKLQSASGILPMQNLTEFLGSIDTSYRNEALGEMLSYYKISSKLTSSGSFIKTQRHTFTWDTGGGSTNYNNNDFVLNIMKANGDLIFSKNVGNVTSYTPTTSEWTTIVNSGTKGVRWNVTARQNDFWGNSGPFLSNTGYLSPINTGSRSFNAEKFDTVFENEQQQGQYFFYEKQTNVSISSDYLLSTNRLRCSYIENEYLVLSSNRSGAGTAFLELNFQEDINELEFDISLWSSTENIFDGSSTIKLQYRNSSGNWVTNHSFSISSLSKNRQSMNHYVFNFADSSNYGIRIIVETSNPSGSNNKGRVCLDNFTIRY
jgi:hypothetical protein